MTTASADDAVEEAFEAFLAGRPAPPGHPGLVAFGDAVRASATPPGRPSAALADLLVTGLLTDQSSPSAATAPSAGRTARRAPVRSRRRRIRMLAPALFAKFAAAGVAAKAATVAGVAVAGFSTVGFIGGLPTPAQHAFATVVDHATPFVAPDPVPAGAAVTPAIDGTPTTDGGAGDVQQPTTDGSGDTGDSGGTTGEDTPSTPTPFGQQVSQMAHDNKADGHPGVDGRTVSSMAHDRHSAGAEDAADGDTVDRPGDGDSTDQPGDDPSTVDGGTVDPLTQDSATVGGAGTHGRSGKGGHGNR